VAAVVNLNVKISKSSWTDSRKAYFCKSTFLPSVVSKEEYHEKNSFLLSGRTVVVRQGFY
jgi:hypothetical protein